MRLDDQQKSLGLIAALPQCKDATFALLDLFGYGPSKILFT